MARTQQDVDAEAFAERQLDEMAKRSPAGADMAYAVRVARRGRSDAGLDCEYDENGEAYFTDQQGRKAAAHGREDAAATLVLQFKILERLDRHAKANRLVLVVLLLILVRVFALN